jgi:hypothetical protein
MATRWLTGLAALALVAAVIGGDLAGGTVPNPYEAPALLALGSGAAPGGAFCAVPPPE